MTTPAAQRPIPFEIWALIAGSFSVALGYGVVAPVLPQLASSFGVSFTAASLIVSAFAAMRLVFAPLSGWLVNRFGERVTYTTGLLIVAASTGACAIAATYGQLLTLRSLGGIGSTMFSIAATGLMIRLAPVRMRGRVSSYNATAFLIGGLLGPVLGGLVAGFGLRAPFIFYFVMLLIAAAIVAVALRRSTALPRGAGSGGDQPPAQLGEALRLSQYRGAIGSMFVFGWSSFGVRVATVPLFIAAASWSDPAVAGWALAAYAAGNAIFVLPSGRWADAVGRRPLLIFGALVGAAGFALLPFSSAIWMVLGAMFIAGVGSAFSGPSQQAVVADVVGKRRGGQVVATTQMVSDLGAVFGPLVIGLVVDGLGFGWGFGITAALMASVSVLWLFTPDSRVLQPPETGATPIVGR